MCDTCGCSDTETVQDNSHGARRIEIEKSVLEKNNQYAEENREIFKKNNLLVLNLISSPGAGKTSLLEKTFRDLKEEISFAVIEGDQQTDRDARRIEETGVPVVQINTAQGCHLDGKMVGHTLANLDLASRDVLIIENVGNLICPAFFDLGETCKIALLSTPEGEDKILKYPSLFQMAQVLIITKTDLLPYVNFNLEKCKEMAYKVHPKLEILETSSCVENGLSQWYSWLKGEVKEKFW